MIHQSVSKFSCPNVLEPMRSRLLNAPQVEMGLRQGSDLPEIRNKVIVEAGKGLSAPELTCTRKISPHSLYTTQAI